MFLKTIIKSHHHRLNEDSFSLFAENQIDLRISDIKDDSLTLCVESLAGEGENNFLARAHSIISYYLVAINVATLGHFSWDFQLVSPVPYFKTEEPDDFGDFVFMHRSMNYEFGEDHLDITPELVWRSIKIMIALGYEKDEVFLSEYIKGIYNLHNYLFNIDFRNESFSNFYKAFEYFCTAKILEVKNLKNEKAQLKGVLNDFGFNENIISDFDEIYVARCNDVMHAQKGIKAGVDKDLIIKLKIFLDSLLHRHYEPLWKKSDN